MKSYISNIRAKLGSEKFIHPGARILIENDSGQFLFIRRKDNGKLGLPAGALEEDESIEECIFREVKEETGIHVIQAEVIGISSNPLTETVKYPNGDVIQYFTVEFYCNQWSGEIKVEDKKEIIQADFLDKKYLQELPKNERNILTSLEYFQQMGKVRIS